MNDGGKNVKANVKVPYEGVSFVKVAIVKYPQFDRLRQDFALDFFYIFLSFFAKIYGPQKNLQNYTSGAVRDGGRDLSLCPAAVGGVRYCSTS
jgi:hypothetical protein